MYDDHEDVYDLIDECGLFLENHYHYQISTMNEHVWFHFDDDYGDDVFLVVGFLIDEKKKMTAVFDDEVMVTKINDGNVVTYHNLLLLVHRLQHRKNSLVIDIGIYEQMISIELPFSVVIWLKS
jgi:hypothetical protein